MLRLISESAITVFCIFCLAALSFTAGHAGPKELFLAALGMIAGYVLARNTRLGIPVFFAIAVFVVVIGILQPPIRATNRWAIIGTLTVHAALLLSVGAILIVSLNEKLAGVLLVGSSLLLLLTRSFSLAGITALSGATALVHSRNTRHLWAIAGSLVLVVAVLSASENRVRRITSFVLSHSTSYQVAQVASSWNGVKLFGQSQSQYVYVPHAHTDFSFLDLVKRMGIGAGILYLFLGAVLINRLAEVAIYSPTTSGRIGAASCSYFVISLAAHLCINLGWLPPSGIAAPFSGRGGTAWFLFALISLSTSRPQRSYGSVINPICVLLKYSCFSILGVIVVCVLVRGSGLRIDPLSTNPTATRFEGVVSTPVETTISPERESNQRLPKKVVLLCEVDDADFRSIRLLTAKLRAQEHYTFDISVLHASSNINDQNSDSLDTREVDLIDSKPSFITNPEPSDSEMDDASDLTAHSAPTIVIIIRESLSAPSLLYEGPAKALPLFNSVSVALGWPPRSISERELISKTLSDSGIKTPVIRWNILRTPLRDTFNTFDSELAAVFSAIADWECMSCQK